ncbi:hypothetical protein [Ramlibacter sp. PS4R-6]|uniref:hypothetical protein n=1 Tax=Ramlibacter sp. PS4R-6 TaxID=3133438 RepID=UPI0030A4344C
MDEHRTSHDDPLAAAYTESVDRERHAWQELHSHAPGSPERIRAWKAWSEAISRTNDAWRRLNARRFSEFDRAHRNARAESHARA